MGRISDGPPFFLQTGSQTTDIYILVFDLLEERCGDHWESPFRFYCSGLVLITDVLNGLQSRNSSQRLSFVAFVSSFDGGFIIRSPLKQATHFLV